MDSKTKSPLLSASKMDGTSTKGYRLQGAERKQEDESRMKRYGPVAVTKDLTASPEKKSFLGGGNLLNGGTQRNEPQILSPDNFKRQDSLYAGP